VRISLQLIQQLSHLIISTNMRLPKPTGKLATLTAGLLLLAMVLGVFIGNTKSISIEHCHAPNHHEHDDRHDKSEHDHPSDDTHEDHAPGDDTHHHHLTMQVSPATFAPVTSITISYFPIPDYTGVPPSQPFPDGPYFELIKPPQIV
jgi:hypothetical protein